MLVMVAEAISMIQVNLLLPVAVRRATRSAWDLMRLPLGILSGMGFSGAGATSPDVTGVECNLSNTKTGSCRR